MIIHPLYAIKASTSTLEPFGNSATAMATLDG